jgi:hypothetical protein
MEPIPMGSESECPQYIPPMHIEKIKSILYYCIGKHACILLSDDRMIHGKVKEAYDNYADVEGYGYIYYNKISGVYCKRNRKTTKSEFRPFDSDFGDWGEPGGEPGGGSGGAADDISDMPNYTPGKPFFLSTQTIKEMLQQCNSRWAYLWLKDGRKGWVKIRKVSHGDVIGTAVINGQRVAFTTTAEGVETMLCR